MTTLELKLACCTPVSLPFPSGYHFCHARDCTNPALRMQKVRSRSDHPAGTARSEAPALRPVPTWVLHPDGCPCDLCGYVDAHLDDDDDRTGDRG